MKQVTNKGLYIARPKQQDNFTNSGDDALLSNKLRGKPFIAFPKTSALPNKEMPVSVKMDEGLFIAYPKNQPVAPAETATDNRIGKLFIAENYMAPVFRGNTISLPALPKRKKRARRQRSFGLALVHMFKMSMS